MPPLFAPPQRMADPIPFLPQFFPPEISSFWGTSIAITPFGTQEVLPTPAGKKYLTGSSPLTSSPSMNLTHPLFSIAPLAVAPLLTFPLLLLLLPFVAPGRCYRTLVNRILPAAPANTRPRTPLISFCTVQLRTLCAAHSLATLCPFTTSGPDPGELPGFWSSMVFRHAPIPRKGWGKQQHYINSLYSSLTYLAS